MEKKRRHYIYVVLAALTVASLLSCDGIVLESDCETDYDDSYFICVSPDRLTFKAKGGTEWVYVTTNYERVKANCKVKDEVKHPSELYPKPLNTEHEVRYFRLAFVKTANIYTVDDDVLEIITGIREVTEVDIRKNKELDNIKYLDRQISISTWQEANPESDYDFSVWDSNSLKLWSFLDVLNNNTPFGKPNRVRYRRK